MKTTDEMTGEGSLVAQAQEAYEQKRTKECVNLIRQVLATDPDNAEVRTLQAWIQSDIERDLIDARTLLRDSQKDGGLKYRKAAEIILLKILYLDADHSEAKSLLAEARGTPQVQTPASPSLPAEHAVRSHSEDLIFTAAPVPFENHAAKKRGGLSGKLPILIVAALIVAVGVVLTYGFWAKKPNVASTDEVAPATVAEKPKLSTASVTAPPVKPLAAPTPIVEAATVVVPAVPDTPPPVVTGKGWLAVRSATSAEIYMNGKHLGETPTTLQLNSGRQTLEYRHDNLKTTMTHEIKPKETTTAFVTFEVDVQINARPWAQVFVEGSTRRALGQTPLGSVRIPIGSTLTFENPSFPSKTHKVTDKESAIQVVFP